MEMMQ